MDVSGCMKINSWVGERTTFSVIFLQNTHEYFLFQLYCFVEAFGIFTRARLSTAIRNDFGVFIVLLKVQSGIFFLVSIQYWNCFVVDTKLHFQRTETSGCLGVFLEKRWNSLKTGPCRKRLNTISVGFILFATTTSFVCEPTRNGCASELIWPRIELCSCASELIWSRIDLSGCASELIWSRIDLCGCASELIWLRIDLCGCESELIWSRIDLSACASELICSRIDLCGCASELIWLRIDLCDCASELIWSRIDLSACASELICSRIDLCGCASELIWLRIDLSACASELIWSRIDLIDWFERLRKWIDLSTNCCAVAHYAQANWSDYELILSRIHLSGCASEFIWSRIHLSGCASELIWSRIDLSGCASELIWSRIYLSGCTSELIWSRIYLSGCANELFNHKLIWAVAQTNYSIKNLFEQLRKRIIQSRIDLSGCASELFDQELIWAVAQANYSITNWFERLRNRSSTNWIERLPSEYLISTVAQITIKHELICHLSGSQIILATLIFVLAGWIRVNASSMSRLFCSLQKDGGETSWEFWNL